MLGWGYETPGTVVGSSATQSILIFLLKLGKHGFYVSQEIPRGNTPFIIVVKYVSKTSKIWIKLK